MISKLYDDGYTCGMFDVIGMPEFNGESWTYYIVFYATHDNRLIAVQAQRMLDRGIMVNTLKPDKTWHYKDWAAI